MKSLRSIKGVETPTTVRALAQRVGLAGQVSVLDLMKLLTLATQPRPFYMIRHRCNDLGEVAAAVASGVNAFECDVQFSDDKNVEFAINHDYANLGVPIKKYLDGVADILSKNPQVALVIFDTKDDDKDRAVRMRDLIRQHLTDKVPVNVIISQASFDSRDFFVPIKAGLRPREAYAIDQDDDPRRVSKFFRDNGVANQCFGDGVFAPGVPVNIPPAILDGVGLKWLQLKEHPIRWVYVWTLAAQTSMREYIRMGVDGIMVNDAPALKAVLGEPEFKNRVRLATRDENPFRPPFLPAYVLTVKTSGVEHSGTDALLTFELRGSKGAAANTIDAEPAGLFERGGVNLVTLIGADVGEIQELVISQSGGRNAPDWLVETVQVQKGGSGDALTFDFTQWIRANRPARRTPALVHYDLTFTTKDEGGAGTDADVKVVLKGTKGAVEKEFNGFVGERFESGQTDKLWMRGIDIGALKSVTVSHDGSGLGDAWLLSRISVKGGSVNASVDFNVEIVEGKPVTKNV